MDSDIARFIGDVRHNCDISDARSAGFYSLCGLLLRLRDLYKWEHALPPWMEPQPAVLMDWIEAKEASWEGILHLDFKDLRLDGKQFDPFDVEEVNGILHPLGMVYGAGYGAGMKPTFFLAERIESRIQEGLTVEIVGREHARDMFTTPAMRQGSRIFGRRSAMLFFLWDQVLEMKPSSSQSLRFALSEYGIDADAMRRQPKLLAERLHRVAEEELDTWIYHELGEAAEAGFYGDSWHQIVSTYSNSPVEVFARVVKDILADTHPRGLLDHIISAKRRSSIAFYIAFTRPFSRAVFPEVRTAFSQFQATGNWAVVEAVRELGYNRARNLADSLMKIHAEVQDIGVDCARQRILSELIAPTGVLQDSYKEDEQ